MATGQNSACKAAPVIFELTAIQASGNTLHMTIPQAIVRGMGLHPKDKILVTVKDGGFFVLKKPGMAEIVQAAKEELESERQVMHVHSKPPLAGMLEPAVRKE